MFEDMLRDLVTIKTRGGEAIAGVRASVQPGKIFTQRTDIPIQPGDEVIRRTPAGVDEIFIVEDPGFQAGLDEIWA